MLQFKKSNITLVEGEGENNELYTKPIYSKPN
jgi:hypothetical protein